jgi:hypothetical protein
MFKMEEFIFTYGETPCGAVAGITKKKYKNCRKTKDSGVLYGGGVSLCKHCVKISGARQITYALHYVSVDWIGLG